MVETLQEVQLPLLACVLISACIAKIAFREQSAATDPGPLTTLRRHRFAVVTVALIEGCLGVAILLTAHPVARLATIVVFFVATSVVFELRGRKADEGCGCFGGLSITPVRFRAVVRACLLLAAAIAVVAVPATGLDVIREATRWHTAIAVAELAVFAALSPEIGVLVARRRERVPCEHRTVPLSETFAILHASDQWREYAPLIVTADPVDVWRELCWRFLAYGGRQDDEDVEIVFAVSTEERHPVVRGAIVRPDDDDSDTGPNHMYALSV
ncbi:MAG TPA: MauE/DoxX family redox-associated membrane protein [Streptosporangiaceae bacterium]|nr:MauE/DoxX family redox-associated membrane protein [Streptosporangiaceae bacterium]